MATPRSEQSRQDQTWRKKWLLLLDQILPIINDLEDYWPLTLRQIYYQLVAAGTIDNNMREYKRLSRVLTKARLQGLVPWESMEDRTRVTLDSAGWSDKQEFIDQEVGNFLEGYRRDLLQSQDLALELHVEKDALSRVCHRVAFTYCVPVIVARGFSSISYVHECRRRIEQNTADGKEATVVLYFGDLDPSGWEMLPAMMTTLQDEMGLGDQVVPQRCALTVEQVEEYNLPHNPDALKASDSRAKKYLERFGTLAVELDALPPATLESLVRESIERNLDMSQFEAEQAQEADELNELADLKVRVVEGMGDVE